ncbi:MAG: fibronectin type III domain-containing protein [bacterium]|nr:fibronectin type III domain-containing protein [bacterium]
MRMRSLSFGVVLLLLAALHVALAPSDQAAAQEAGDDGGALPLSVTLTSSRAVCTANTLTELTWTITGGVPPYRLGIDGVAVARTAASHRANCGPLATDPESGAPLPNQTKTFTATVTDARGVSATGAVSAELAAPLPAPTGVTSSPLRTAIALRWDRVPGTGPTPTPASECPCPLYLVRWRPIGTETWTTIVHVDHYSNLRGAGFYRDEFLEGTTYEFVVAALRGAIEQETPAALAWSAPVTATTLAPPTGVRATATHDTITVTWDPQPAAGGYVVSIWGPDGSTFQEFTPDGNTPHQVVFHDLPPGTEYRAEVMVPAAMQSPRTEITVRTAAAPPGWVPLPRGPQNLRTSATHNSVTVAWDAPHTGANDQYSVFLFHTGADREPTATDRREHKLLSGAGVTQHTFRGLAPATTYRVAVRHPDIVSGRVEVAVTTLAAPAAGASTRPVETECFEITPGWPICLTPAATPA